MVVPAAKRNKVNFVCVCVAFLLAYYTRLQLGCPVDVRYIRIGSRKDKNGHADYL